MTELENMKIEYSSECLLKKIKEIGAKISHDYDGKELVMIGVLKGSIYFFADLTREITIPIQLDFISMGLSNGSSVFKIIKDLDTDITDKHVIIVENIIRTGLTISYLIKNLEARKPASIKVCTLLVNPNQQLINVPIAYEGFRINDEWLLGYGLDINGENRNLPYILKMDKKV